MHRVARARPLRRRSAAALLVCVLSSTAGAGAAAAYWTTGSGEAFGWGSVSPAEVAGTSKPFPSLYPGATVVVPITLVNNNDAAFAVKALRLDDRGIPDTCPTSAWSFQVPSPPSLPARESAAIDVSVTLLDDAPASCQGQSFSLSLLVEGNLR